MNYRVIARLIDGDGSTVYRIEDVDPKSIRGSETRPMVDTYGGFRSPYIQHVVMFGPADAVSVMAPLSSQDHEGVRELKAKLEAMLSGCGEPVLREA